MEDDSILFEMGLYEARLPTRLRYADVHFWFDTQSGMTRCGLTSYAARLLDEVFRLEWKVSPGIPLEEGETLGVIESNKATSELYAPMSGRLVEVNAEIVEKPSKIGEDPYAAWLLAFEGAPASSLNAEEYRKFLADGWEETQKLLKGQM